MASSTIKKELTIHFFDYTLEETSYTEHTPIRFNVPLQANELDVSRRVSAFPYNSNYSCNLTADGKMYITREIGSGTDSVTIRVFYCA